MTELVHARPAELAVPDVPAREQLAGAWLLAQDSNATVEAYRRDLRQFFAWADQFGIDVLTAVRVHIDGYRRWLSGPAEGRPRGYGKATIARKLSALSSFYVYCASVDAVQGNPVSAVKRPRAPKSDTPWLSIDELRQLFAAADATGPWDAALVRVLYYSAVRVSELCNASVGDLRVDDDVLTLRVDRKGGGTDRVAIATPGAQALRAHLRGRQHGPLFLRGADRVDRNQVAYAITRIARAAGLGHKKLTPHGLRHSAVTHLLRDEENKASPVQVQEHAGHARIETTLGYLHGGTAAKDSPTHRLAQLVEGSE